MRAVTMMVKKSIRLNQKQTDLLLDVKRTEAGNALLQLT